MTTINKKFIEWACSFSGCDGGNIHSNIWIVGIEWGVNKGNDEDKDYYLVELPSEIEKGKIKLPPDLYNWKESITNKYGIGVAKLFCSLINHDVDDYKKKIELLKGSEIFKLNLYPIAFQNTDNQLWDQYNLKNITGFYDKDLFRIWCLFNRFPFFSDLTRDYNPELIICTGISYLSDFILFFGGEKSLNKKIECGEIKPNSSSNNKYIRQYYWAKLNNITKIVIIPFFSGRYGLNSNYLIEEMGKQIRRIIS